MAAVLVVGAAVLPACDDSSGDDADAEVPASEAAAPDASPSTTAALDEEGADLEALLVAGRGATVHAVYEATGTGADGQPAAPYVLEVFRRDGRLRQDTTTETPQGEFRTAGLLVDGVSTVCQQQPGDDWVCSAGSDADAGAADGVFGTVLDELRGLEVETTEETIGEHAVRCFTSAADGGARSICVTDDGLPVRVVAGSTTLELVSVDEDVPDSAFEPPAAPLQAEAEG